MTANPFADTSTLDFIANTLYVADSIAKGHTPLRWMVLRPEIHKHYLELAAARYTDWVENERNAQVQRSTP